MPKLSLVERAERVRMQRRLFACSHQRGDHQNQTGQTPPHRLLNASSSVALCSEEAGGSRIKIHGGPILNTNLAEGQGFEPWIGLHLYQFSRLTPSTGLGHPYARQLRF